MNFRPEKDRFLPEFFAINQLTNAYSCSGNLTLNPCKLLDMTVTIRIGSAAGKRTVMNYITTLIQKSPAMAFKGK